MSKLLAIQPCEVEAREFVEFWEPRYRYTEDDTLYDQNAGKHTEEALTEMFKWKIGKRFLNPGLKAVRKNFIPRYTEFSSLPSETTADEFLRAFSDGGAIWRIFWLHCWKQEFPIYDQHVHRAMVFIQNRKVEELTTNNKKVVTQYLTEYLPFYQKHFAGMDQRKSDRAIWAFGKFIKRWKQLESA